MIIYIAIDLKWLLVIDYAQPILCQNKIYNMTIRKTTLSRNLKKKQKLKNKKKTKNKIKNKNKQTKKVQQKKTS